MKLGKYIVIITLYLTFIALGLPDQMLGVAWPQMRADLGLDLDKAGVLISAWCLMGALASFFAGRIIKNFSIFAILITSVCLNIFGLLGVASSSSFSMVIICFLIWGAGAGTIDSYLNDYVGKKYSSKHMNWLHGFWGVGAALGPAIMTLSLVFDDSWRLGYVLVAFVLCLLVVFFIFTRKIWENDVILVSKKCLSKCNKFSSLPVLLSIFMFFIYSCVETCVGLWFYSFMIEVRKFDIATAGFLVVCYWATLTIGRFVLGSFSADICNKKIINISLLVSLLGFSLLFINSVSYNLLGLLIIGGSFAGIYPSMMHETPKRFESSLASTVMGYQVGMALLGVGFLVPVIGFIIGTYSLMLLLPILIGLTATMLVMSLILNR